MIVITEEADRLRALVVVLVVIVLSFVLPYVGGSHHGHAERGRTVKAVRPTLSDS